MNRKDWDTATTAFNPTVEMSETGTGGETGSDAKTQTWKRQS